MSETNFFDNVEITTENNQGSYIKVIGVGGAGTNAVNHMYEQGIQGVDFIVLNTDQQSLDSSPITTKVKIGEGGLGAGNNPEVAQKAAIAAADNIRQVISRNTHMLFITAGMGGGTGTGASPEIAKIAKEVEVDGGKDEILVVAVVTTPFSWEGRKRMKQAQVGVDNLKAVVDSMIIINTNKLMEKGDLAITEAFSWADDVLLTAVKGVSEMITVSAYINVDFRDVQSVMQKSGVALMGVGVGQGDDRAYEAIQAASTSELLNDNDLSKTKNILLYVSYPSKKEYEVRMSEITTITNYIQENINEEADIIWGAGPDEHLEDQLSVTLVATGFEAKPIETSKTPIIGNVKQEPKQETKQEEPEIKIISNTEKEPVKEEPTTLNIVSESFAANKIEEQPKAQTEQKDLEFTIINKTSEQTSVSEQPKQDTKTVITLNIDEEIPDTITPATNNYQSHEQTETKEDIMDEFRKADQEAKNSAQSEEQISLRDITADSMQSEGESMERQQEMNTLSKTERIKRIREMLKSGNISLVQSLKPTDLNFDEKLSEQSQPNTIKTLNSDGNIIVKENNVIGSQVD